MPPDTLTFAFDTSAAHCAVALLSGDTVLADVTEEMQKGQVERLFPLLESVLERQGFGWTDIDQIGVGIGPGNFTGIRISVSAARGLAMSLGIPAIGVTSFEALALGQKGPVIACVDARGGRVYIQNIDGSATQLPEMISADQLADIGQPVVGFLPDGTGSPKYSTPVAIAMLAAARKDDRIDRPAPLYVREADAAPSRIASPLIVP